MQRQFNPSSILAMRTLQGIVGCIVFYLAFAWLAVNPLAQWLIPKLAASQLASHASVEKVSFDPLALTLSVDKLVLTDQHAAPLASVDRLTVDLEASGLFRWAWKLKEITVTTPRIHLAISKAGKFNWSDLIAKLNEQPSPPDQTLPRVIIERIAIEHGDIQYVDAHHASPLTGAITPLNFTLEGFSTLPEDRGDYLLVANLPQQGGRLKWKGDIGVNPVASKGRLAIEGLQLPKLLPLLNSPTNTITVQTGSFSGQFDYALALTQNKAIPDQTQSKLSLHDMQLSLNGIKCSLPHGEHVLFDSLTLSSQGLEIDQKAQLTLLANHLAVDLNKLAVHKAQTDLSIASAKIHLPHLALHDAKVSQLRFADLNVQLNQTQLTHAQQVLLQLPKLAIQKLSVDLAKQQANIAHIVLDNGQISAAHDAAGILNWQQMFSAINAPQEGSIKHTASDAQSASGQPFRFAVDDIALTHWQLKYANQQFAQPLSAQIADFNLHLQAENQTGLRFKNIALHTRKLNFLANQTALLDLDALTIEQGQLAIAQHKAEAAAIRLHGLKTTVIRQADQRLNWQALLTPAAHPQQSKSQPQVPGQTHAHHPPSTASQPPAWAFALKQLSMTSAAIHIEDQTTASPMRLDIVDGHLDVFDLNQHLEQPRPVSLGLKIQQGGQFNVKGKLAAMPLKADLKCTLDNLSLRPFTPYLQQVALLEIERGTLNLQGMASVLASGKAEFSGALGIQQLSLVETSSQQPFVRWEALQADALKLTTAPNALQMGTLTLDALRSKWLIYPDHSLNISKMFRSHAEAPVASGTGSTGGASSLADQSASTQPTSATLANHQSKADFPINIDLLRIKNSELEFADYSLPQPFGTHMHSLNGVITGINSRPNVAAQVEIDGKVDDYGAVRIRGKLDPFHATEYTDLKLAFRNLEMNRLTPYSGKFAGRKIESGKLSAELEYNIKQRKLTAENKLVIHQLKLGDKIESKEAANLPLDLAIALLEDSHGVIDLDLPVSGSLEDPKFSLGSLVWKALSNVIGKIVTAPFAALGKLFGSNEKLEAIGFDPGESTLLPPELEKLHAVSRILVKRPQLTLAIEPGYDVLQDTRAIKEARLRRQVATETGIHLEPGLPAPPIDINHPKVQAAIQALHDRLTHKALLKRLAAKLEKTPEGFYAEALDALTASMAITDNELQTLANARASAIQSALIQSGTRQEQITLRSPTPSKADNHALVATKLTLETAKH